jgi:hypothetical protein
MRSKSDAAMKNEVLLKFLCHNVVVVHQAIVELGIVPVFWPEEPAADEGPRDMLRFLAGGRRIERFERLMPAHHSLTE